jgi:hypothetical protein
MGISSGSFLVIALALDHQVVHGSAEWRFDP